MFVDEQSVEDTIFVLRGLKEKYELHHGVRITDDALVAAARLSHRYINERFLPDKAIDVMDEAASHLRIEADSKPAELDRTDRQIMQLRIEQAALQNDNEKPDTKRLNAIAKELTSLERQSATLGTAWHSVKAKTAEVVRLQQAIEDTRHTLDVAQREGNLEVAAELTYGKLPALSQDLALAKEAVAESELLSDVGQTDAVNAVANATWRARAGLADPDQPMGSFLMLDQRESVNQNFPKPWRNFF